MKKISVGLAIGVVVACTSFVDAAFAGVVGNRQARQHARIHQGVTTGELTPWETSLLKREQCRIQGAKRMAWSDGHLTYRERTRLDNMQDRSSRHIYRLKHNWPSW